MITLLGDIHGHLDRFTVPQDKGPIIQLGDLGMGFNHIDQHTQFEDIDYFIRGNHDNPRLCRIHRDYLGDFGVNEKIWLGKKIFFVSGAYSIDQDWRIEDLDWWRNEELHISELNQAIDLYEQVKPDIMLTHTCPESLIKMLKNNTFRDKPASRTEVALQTMLEIHQPRWWVFGHWHPAQNWHWKFMDTNFVCVAIDKYFSLE